MRDLKNKLTSSKNTKNIKNRRGKSFGYQVLGFGAGGGRADFEPFTADFLMVAGGGAGSNTSAGGAGGAGGMLYSFSNPNAAGVPFLVETTYAITIGAGAAGARGNGTAGSNTVMAYNGASRTSYGGGRGGTAHSDGPNGNLNGGSGGGGGGGSPYPAWDGGAGNTPPISAANGGPQGSPGGMGYISIPGPSGPGQAAGGGGGATADGGDGASGQAGVGGAGRASSITGSAVTYAGGGGGGANATTSFGAGGAGGGGIGGGGNPYPQQAGSGVANTGGGGGGSSFPYPNGQLAGAGGSGVVIIRSPADSEISVTGGSNTVSTLGPGEQVARFVSSGNYVVGI